ncbi:hypothetical protein KVR01_013593 [Diaporthe batatas]|uniref:uncharacterized protein n=1 Tax=Diaporthe batatas TaxID=748121 RepID=UPI001D0573BF|nr:uncharacterized protein KVR01_013593 [Diaporthe batatas]KAG8156489.1 hypothetical protein KVR01_013593 [Diaporthe batatas]
MLLLAIAIIVEALIGRATADPWDGDRKRGNGFFMKTLPFNNWIVHATYSVTLPNIPCGYVPGGDEQVALWIGMQDNPGNRSTLYMSFVQPLFVWGPTPNVVVDPACNAETWCGTASTWVGEEQVQYSAGFTPVAVGTTLDMEISVGEAVTQTIYIGREVFSTQTGSPGMRPGVFNSQSECITNSCGTLESFEWKNLRLTLNKAQPDWGPKMKLANATTAGWETPDSGVTDYMYMDNSVHEC